LEEQAEEQQIEPNQVHQDHDSGQNLVVLSVEEFYSIRDALDSVLTLYGRHRIKPYPHEHHAWQQCRSAMILLNQIAARFSKS